MHYTYVHTGHMVKSPVCASCWCVAHMCIGMYSCACTCMLQNILCAATIDFRGIGSWDPMGHPTSTRSGICTYLVPLVHGWAQDGEG